MTRPIRIGLVGFGWMGQAHSRSYRSIPAYFPDAGIQPRLVAIADTVPERTALAVDNFGLGSLGIDITFVGDLRHESALALRCVLRAVIRYVSHAVERTVLRMRKVDPGAIGIGRLVQRNENAQDTGV